MNINKHDAAVVDTGPQDGDVEAVFPCSFKDSRDVLNALVLLDAIADGFPDDAVIIQESDDAGSTVWRVQATR